MKTLTPELYRAITEEAHKYGVPVGVHNVKLTDAKELLRAGVEGWLHVPVRGGDFVDDEVIAHRQGPHRPQLLSDHVGDARPADPLDELAGTASRPGSTIRC